MTEVRFEKQMDREREKGQTDEDYICTCGGETAKYVTT